MPSTGAILPGVRAQRPGPGLRLRLPQACRRPAAAPLDDLLRPLLQLLPAGLPQAAAAQTGQVRVSEQLYRRNG